MSQESTADVSSGLDLRDQQQKNLNVSTQFNIGIAFQ